MRASVATTVLLVLGLVSASRARGQCPCAVESVVVCGHRGTGSNDADNPYPENTVASFVQAVAEGAQMVELDVHHSADAELVVIHDAHVDETTDGMGCVGSMTLATLRQLDAGAGTAMAGAGITIPTLDEALAAIAVDVNIEIKIEEGGDCPAPDRARLAADVLAAIQSARAGRRIITSSFDGDVLAELERLDPTVHTSLLSTRAADVDRAIALGLDGFNPFVIAATPETVDAAHAAGLDVGVWTVNTAEEIDALLDLGVEMVITDAPDLADMTRRAWCERAGCVLPPAAPPPPPPPPPGTSSDDGGCSIAAAGPIASSSSAGSSRVGSWLLLLGALGVAMARSRRGSRR